MRDNNASTSNDGDELSLPSRRYLQAQAWHIAALLSRWYPELSISRRENDYLLQVLSGPTNAVVTFTVDTINYRERGLESLELDWLDVFATPFPDAAAETIETGLRSGRHLGGERRETAVLPTRPLIYLFIARFLALTVHDRHQWDVFEVPNRYRTPETPAGLAVADMFPAGAALNDQQPRSRLADSMTISDTGPEMVGDTDLMWILTRDGTPELFIDTDGVAATPRTQHSIASLVATCDGNVDFAVTIACGTLLP